MTDCELEPIDGTGCVNAGLGYGLGVAPGAFAGPGDGDDPSRPCDAVSRMSATWRMIDDLIGGTAKMREAGVLHLPKFPFETVPAYEFRLCTAVLFPAYSRTASVLTGKPFSKPITIGKDVPGRIKGYLEDVDREGRNLDAFAAAVCADALAYGIAGILVDAPPSNGARTVAEEQNAGIRPYFVHVRHDAILGWKTEGRGKSTVLTQLRLMETAEEPVGRFGLKSIPQVRVLEPGRWETYRKVKGSDGRESWQVHEEGRTSLGVIPFVPVYGSRVDHMVGRPPMLDLAYLNVEHWQSKSDQQTILSAARIPILFTKGMVKEDKVAIGAGTMIQAENPAADMKFVEHTGSAIEAGRTSILDLEDKMRQVGAELLVIKPGNTSVAQTFADNEPAMCDLQRIMQSLEDGLDLALSYMAKFVGIPDGGHVSIYSDFGVATLAEASAQLLVDMQADGYLTQATTLNELKRRGVLSPEVDVDAEIAATKVERKAAQDAAAERELAMLYPEISDQSPPGRTSRAEPPGPDSPDTRAGRTAERDR